MDNASYYNALAIAYRGSYAKLSRALARYGTWKDAWAHFQDAPDPQRERRILDDHRIELLLREDGAYPFLLREAPVPPFGLYSKGDLNYTMPAVAVIGTRAATAEGKATARSFARALAQAGIPIISGLALGIDAEAHRGALEVGGKTIAVLGTPLDSVYPKQHHALANEIVSSGGALVSEFAIGHPYHASNFLSRNRIISGLSTAILIVEAPERSGTLATARFALEQNRDIFVIPGSITSRNYKGSHELIKAGAALVTSPEDIFMHLGIAGPGTETELPNLTEPEQRILAAVRDGHTTAEKMLEATGAELTELYQLLASLTIKGILKELNGKYSLN
ncbi:DNA-processing protein DprA [Patescibacteria group bacterium]|nr:DNA-processing protein DprA [Patescibacteria group bacterium]